MIIEKIEIHRSENGDLASVRGLGHLEKLLNQYKKEGLKSADKAFHYEAEIAAGFRFFIEWLKVKTNTK